MIKRRTFLCGSFNKSEIISTIFNSLFRGKALLFAWLTQTRATWPVSLSLHVPADSFSSSSCQSPSSVTILWGFKASICWKASGQKEVEVDNAGKLGFIKNLSPKLYLCDRACVKFGNKMTSTFFHLRWNENNNVVLQWNNSHYLNQLQLFLWTIYVIDLTENNHKILKYLHNNNYRMSV